MTKLPLFIYHKNCFDGFAASWVFSREVGDAEWWPATYGDHAPNVVGRIVWMVDFSYPREAMNAISREAEALYVLDHHKTAEAALAGLKGQVVRFDMKRSGCGLLWDEFRPRAPRPWLVDYIEDRDLWRLALPRIHEVQAWVSAQPFTFDAYDAMLAAGRDDCADKGSAIQLYIDQYGRKAREQARAEIVGGHSVPTINLPYMNCSEHVGALLQEHPEAPFSAGYFRRADGRWQFSLRSRPDFDCSVVAKLYGGGGHAGASGFDVSDLPWTRPLPGREPRT